MKTVGKRGKGEMRKEYRREDLGVGVLGKHYKEYMKGTNLVLLSPDMAAAFPDEDSVNDALRGFLSLARRTARLQQHPSRQKSARG